NRAPVGWAVLLEQQPDRVKVGIQSFSEELRIAHQVALWIVVHAYVLAPRLGQELALRRLARPEHYELTSSGKGLLCFLPLCSGDLSRTGARGRAQLHCRADAHRSKPCLPACG